MNQKAEGKGQKTEILCRCAAPLLNVRLCRNKAFVFCSLSSVLCLLPSAFCHAEELPDPTRQPIAIAAPVPVTGQVATENKPAGLQSIIISPTRRAAIMDGKIIELGGKYGDAKLIEVTENGVVLQGAHGKQVMALFPDVQMSGKWEDDVKLPVDNLLQDIQKPVAQEEKK